MAGFKVELPNDIIKDIQKVSNNADKIFGDMTQAGAQVVEHNIRANAPDAIKKSKMMDCLRVTKVYKTPSNDGINTKVAFYGKFIDADGREKKSEIVGNVFEYGRSGAPFLKQPFMRKSFKKKEIEQAMLKVQKEASGGLLDE